MPTAARPVIVVGAGVSGLACAGALAAAGRAVRVVERARGVGGRCATRRVEGQPVDFGVSYLHGHDRAFLAALREVPATPLPGWPRERLGAGRPCQPAAFEPGEERLAFREGVDAFPRHLARRLDVSLETAVASLEAAPGGVRLALEGGGVLEANLVVLALAAEQSQALLATLGDAREARAAAALLDTARSHACLALIAAYRPDVPPPPWDASFPEGSRILQAALHESAKRAPAPFLALVLQGHAGWSRAHEEDAGWPEALLAEAGRVLGPWAARPRLVQAHRWRWARVDRASELAAPLLLALPGGGRLGVCGDRFAPGGGVEAAWRSGRALAARVLEEGA